MRVILVVFCLTIFSSIICNGVQEIDYEVEEGETNAAMSIDEFVGGGYIKELRHLFKDYIDTDGNNKVMETST